MARRLVFRRRVGRDLARAFRWYEQERAGLGEEFLAQAGASLDTIERLPEMFARVEQDVRRALVSRFPYGIFYRVKPDRVVVLAVLHTARDPRLWPRSKR